MAEVPTVTDDGEKKSSHFPDAVIRDLVVHGGPHGRGVEVEIDGNVVQKLTHLELIADVNDAVRLRTEQIVAISDLSLKVVSWEKIYVADVRVWTGTPGEIDSEPRDIKGKGANAIEALEDALRQIKELAP